MFFTFPEGRPLERRAAGGGVGIEIGEYSGVVGVPRCVFQRLLPERSPPSGAWKPYLHRTRFERIAERKLRRRQLTEDGNIDISERDLR